MTEPYLTQGLHRSVRQNPDATAVTDGDRTTTFRELYDRVARLAGGLNDLGVGTDDRVAILSLNSDRYIEVLYGILWAGGVMVPVNTRWSAAEIVYSLRDAEASVVLVDETYVETVRSIRAECPSIKHVVLLGTSAPAADELVYDDLLDRSSPVEDARRSGDDLAGIFYTGGTTGFPKGVMLSHVNLLTSSMGGLARVGMLVPDGRYLHVAPMFHLGDVSVMVNQVVMGGAHVVLPSFTATSVIDAVRRHDITDVTLVPTMIRMLVEELERTDSKLTSLRNLIYGGSPIEEQVLRRALTAIPSARFTQVYGMTELSPCATILAPEDHVPDGSTTKTVRLRSAGRTAPHAEVRVIDDLGNDVPHGQVGEIICRGAHVMLGYWRRPEESAAVLRDGWMHTGDLGRFDDGGYLFVVDRLKDMIVSGGENVYSAEVENALAMHPSVAACAVIGVPDAQWGERVHAVVVAADGQTPTLEELQAHARSAIARYKVPRSIEVVDDLPISAAGKILKTDLRARYATV